ARTATPRPGPTSPAAVVARPATVAPETVTAPTRLEIARIGLSMAVEPVAVADDGQMALPTTVRVAGWYRFGPAPGSRAGSSVIAGHVDTAAEGAGPMAGLAGLRTGDVVEVLSGAERHRYRVDSVQAIRKTSLDLPALFDRSGPPRLHLVTCGGPYDRDAHHYEDNVVVVATPLPGD
ncbi:MAG: class F sortase, partial [Actinomycetota bacterium]|nr:class F sortase [Actinomycetota bacterium]